MNRRVALLTLSRLALTLLLAAALKLHMSTGPNYLVAVPRQMPIIADSGYRTLVMVQANPDQGFHWPYLLCLPSSEHRQRNQGYRRYLMVSANNSGLTESFETCVSITRQFAANTDSYPVALAERLWAPLLVPVFPRPPVSYSNTDETNMFHTHILDRDTATLHLMLKDQNLAKVLHAEFEAAGFGARELQNLDLQLTAMIDHAVEYLNRYGHDIESYKVFLTGFGASGVFIDRFANLHPDRVKAVASGGTLDTMMLPLDKLHEEPLPYPLGVYDYQNITGREFDLKAHNQLARLVFMGSADLNNIVLREDCYGERERNTIAKLWGLEILPRAKRLIELYGQCRGQGMFILDQDISQSMSSQMQEYLVQFFHANRNTDTPVYPVPDDRELLGYTLFQP